MSSYCYDVSLAICTIAYFKCEGHNEIMCGPIRTGKLYCLVPVLLPSDFHWQTVPMFADFSSEI